MRPIWARLTPSLSLDDLADCDLVIEAVFENMDVKKELFGKLDKIVKKGAILASNTSYLNIDEMAKMTSRPEDFIGLHFFSPANVMKLLEIVRGEKTQKDVIATAMALAKTIGKVAVLVGVAHGFVGNRMLAQRQREANNLVLEGAMPWQVDKVLYDFGLPMGPFAMSDLVEPRHRAGTRRRRRPRPCAGNPLRERPPRPEDRHSASMTMTRTATPSPRRSPRR